MFVDTPGFQTRHGSALNRTLNRTVRSVLSDVDVVLFVVEAGKFTLRALLPEGTTDSFKLAIEALPAWVQV